MQRGFVYLCAILDWASRRVLAWRLSNTLTTDFCVEAVQEAITRYGTPEIFTTDHGCQFTSQAFTGLLLAHDIQISLDGAGRWRNNVFVERLWRSLEYEEGYLHAYETVRDAQDGVARYLTFYKQIRPHRTLDARPIAWTVTPCLHSPPPRRPHPPGTTCELADTAQTTGTTTEIMRWILSTGS